MAPSLLLDTHALLWWLVEPEKLSSLALAAMNDPAASIFVSAASGWEIATKGRPPRRWLQAGPPRSLVQASPGWPAGMGSRSSPQQQITALSKGRMGKRAPYDAVI
jgi:hypothetical protein